MGQGSRRAGFSDAGDDEALMPLISVANVACGFHASDFNHMRRTVRLARRHGIRVGAHPSLPDLQGFGRREMTMSRDELANCIIYQIGALKGFLDAEGMSLNHIKPHGALYGMAATQDHVAQAISDAADVFRVPLLGMAGTLHETVYRSRGHRRTRVRRHLHGGRGRRLAGRRRSGRRDVGLGLGLRLGPGFYRLGLLGLAGLRTWRRRRGRSVAHRGEE